ncbi:hypothetical protein CAOG_07377 [Capsaspora owczarzaki ATCC 30864]|uniref:hypothetical protein n=1 Tax=Capsaspora owczarzaki (strain ATCC 30864) TaxID=595528 RepID=UPI0001FE4FD1|nr:hypothetical protein CAOG_07377 [Capsaspora owczarzaki ATCC 30864]|eukprot:XP_004343236.1 hypothetical protein CAOG_07377 [Capsaspora owczarzaki ATCC 30864]
MVVAIGTDLVAVSRIAAVYAKRGDRLQEEQQEQQEDHKPQALRSSSKVLPGKHSHAILFLASRWALKEATYKACFPYRLVWSDIQADLVQAKPMLRIDGRLKEALQARGASHAHISLSHDGDYALAFVVLDASGQKG